MKKISYILLLLLFTACAQSSEEDQPSTVSLYINNLDAHASDDFTGKDELVLVYTLNSYRESGTLYATSVGTFHSKDVTPETVKEIKKLVSVPTVEDGHISASFGLVEVDTEDSGYDLGEHEGKIFYNQKDFTFFDRYTPDDTYYGTAAASSWDLIYDSFNFIGIDIKEHLQINLLDANDNLGAYRIDFRNEDLPARTSRSQIDFSGSDYNLTFYLNKNQAITGKEGKPGSKG